jgi:hypothetical protein
MGSIMVAMPATTVIIITMMDAMNIVGLRMDGLALAATLHKQIPVQRPVEMELELITHEMMKILLLVMGAMHRVRWKMDGNVDMKYLQFAGRLHNLLL